jgi:hypothetical protein
MVQKRKEKHELERYSMMIDRYTYSTCCFKLFLFKVIDSDSSQSGTKVIKGTDFCNLAKDAPALLPTIAFHYRGI